MGAAQGGSSAAQLEERYFLQKVKLGQGSFGTVWRAVDRQSGSTVAIKQLDKASLPKRGVTRQDIEREISMMKACSHENITQLFDTFEDNASIYLALEYCEGGDFGDKVKERGMGVDETEVAEWCRQMVASIAALHTKGICHRDIKPDNFMVCGTSTLKLSDFGLALFLPRGKLLQEKCGTPAFMAPEQHHLPKRSPGYSYPADIWAAGVSMYMMMFAGKHPFLNDRGHLDDNLLLTGELDFRDKQGGGGFFGFGATSLRFSEEARRLCKCMVEPDPQRRISADSASTTAWLPIGREASRGRLPTPTGAADAEARRRHSVDVPPAPPQLERHKTVDPQEIFPERRRSAPDAMAAAGGAAAAGAAGAAVDGKSKGAAAMLEAAQLKEQNENLQAELEERKKREEQLMQQQKRLQHQQQLLQHQRTKELQQQNEKLIEQENQLRRVELEKQDLERQRALATDVDGGVNGSKASRRTSQLKESAGNLKRGMKCRYESGTYGWMNAVVQGYNDSDGTYNLDVRQHAALDKIAPIGNITASEAWPPGTLAAYHSASVNQWLPAVVNSYNEMDATYNLDVRDHADLERIRARVQDGDQGKGDQGGCGKATSSNTGYRTEMTSEASSARPEKRRGPTKPLDDDRDGSKLAPLRVSDLEATRGGRSEMATGAEKTPTSPARKVGAGDRAVIPDEGLVTIESVSNGTYTVKTANRERSTVQVDTMRAPGEAKYAWPGGTKVSYQSASLSGKWIDANVSSFNASNGTYNLDVRMEAAPDKVRPR